MLRIVLTILVGLYALSPVDILPEFFLGHVGWLDDLVLLFLLWRFFYAGGRRPWQGPYGRPGEQEADAGGSAEHNGNGPGPGSEPGSSAAAGPRAPHEVLGVLPDASRDEIKQAYKRLAGQYHPDKVHHLADEFQELAEKRFKEIQAAYETLTRKK